MVDLIAQEENNKKHRGGEREEGNCNQYVQKNQLGMHGNGVSKIAHCSGSAVRSTE